MLEALMPEGGTRPARLALATTSSTPCTRACSLACHCAAKAWARARSAGSKIWMNTCRPAQLSGGALVSPGATELAGIVGSAGSAGDVSPTATAICVVPGKEGDSVGARLVDGLAAA